MVSEGENKNRKKEFKGGDGNSNGAGESLVMEGRISSIRRAPAIEEERESKPFRNPLGRSDRRKLLMRGCFSIIQKASKVLNH